LFPTVPNKKNKKVGVSQVAQTYFDTGHFFVRKKETSLLDARMVVKLAKNTPEVFTVFSFQSGRKRKKKTQPKKHAEKIEFQPHTSFENTRPKKTQNQKNVEKPKEKKKQIKIRLRGHEKKCSGLRKSPS